MKMLHSFVPSLAVMLMAASGGAGAQGVLIDRSEIRFVAKQTGGGVEGRFRRWKANVDFRPKDPAKSRAAFEIELASIDLASEETESEVRRPAWFDTAKFPVAKFESTTVRGLGGDRYEIDGRLSIKAPRFPHRRGHVGGHGRRGQRGRHPHPDGAAPRAIIAEPALPAGGRTR